MALYRGGMPTNPKVKELLEYYSNLKNGDKLPYEELETIIEASRKQPRFRTVMQVFRSVLEQNYGIVLGVNQGQGFFVTDDKDKVVLANSKAKTGKNFLRRAATVASRIEHIERLSDEDKKSVDHLMSIKVAIDGINRLRSLSASPAEISVKINSNPAE